MDLELSRPTFFVVASVALVAWMVIFGRKHAKAPGIGYGSLPFIRNWQGVYTFMKDPRKALAEGCRKYGGGYFRIASPTVEYLMVTDESKIREYLAAPEEVLSFHDTIDDFLQVEWTLGYAIAHRPYHIPLVRTKLTQTIASNVPAMLGETREAYQTLVGKPVEWTEFTVYETMVRVVARLSNNAFSGMEFCRNEEFLEIAIDYARGVVVSAGIIRLLPQFLKPFASRFTPYARVQRKARELMGPYIQKRLDMDWGAKVKPKDMVQFLIDGASDVDKTMPQIVERLMTLNMASIHTTSMTVTGAIIFLARNPEYIPELRAEILAHSSDGEFDKNTLLNLTKLDSFLRECGRLAPPGNIALIRHARKDFKFSDGMVVPKYTAVAAPLEFLNDKASNLGDPRVFDGFRYSRMNAESTGPTKNQMVNTELNYLLFGHGKHACPGRFLAVTELKLIVATMLMRYDIRTIPGMKPKDSYFGTGRVPETTYAILLKARELETKH